MKKYIAHITPLNADKIGCEAHGTAEFTEDGDKLHVKVEMFDTPKNIEHWEHFHGFPDGKEANVPTMAQDKNHDGFIDLPETEEVSGTTMVPLDDAPQDIPLEKLQAKFKDAFGTEDLQLDKRVVYVHGIPKDLELPDTVGGCVMNYDAHTTLPIAAGKIEEA